MYGVSHNCICLGITAEIMGLIEILLIPEIVFRQQLKLKSTLLLKHLCPSHLDLHCVVRQLFYLLKNNLFIIEEPGVKTA